MRTDSDEKQCDGFEMRIGRMFVIQTKYSRVLLLIDKVNQMKFNVSLLSNVSRKIIVCGEIISNNVAIRWNFIRDSLKALLTFTNGQNDNLQSSFRCNIEQENRLFYLTKEQVTTSR